MKGLDDSTPNPRKLAQDSASDYQLSSEVIAAILNVELGFAESVAVFERQMIQTALEKNQFNVNRSAELLKMTRHSLRYRMQQLGLANTTKGSGTSDDE